MKKRRVVVTGMGIVSCFGMDVDHFYQVLLAGKSGITPIDAFLCAAYYHEHGGSSARHGLGFYGAKLLDFYGLCDL